MRGGAGNGSAAPAVYRGDHRDLRARGLAVAAGIGSRRHAGMAPVGGAVAVRRASRTRPGDTGQPGRTRRPVERGCGSGIADNAFRDRRHHRAAGGRARRRAFAAPDTGRDTPAGSGRRQRFTASGDGNRSGPCRTACGSRRSAGPRSAARRAEVGGTGDAGLRARGRGVGPHCAARDPGAGVGSVVLPCGDRRPARSGLGSRREDATGAVSAGLGGGGGADQLRPATGRRSADRHHATVRLGGAGAGSRPAAPMGARRCVVHRRPADRRDDRYR